MSVDKDARLFEVNEIDIEKAKQLLSRITPDKDIVEFFRITAGGSTSNYKVRAKTGATYLLRIYSDDNDHSQMEMAGYSYAKALVNVPEIYLCDDSKTILPNTYMLMQFIDGITFREYMALNVNTVGTVCASIGSSLALLHNRQYDHMALLRPDLSVLQSLGSIQGIFERYLAGISGRHLTSDTKQKVHSVISERKDLLSQIDNDIVLSHGDFKSSNIIIDKKGNPWFIDFEYCFSAPRYYDIGKFFRTKDNFDISSIRDDFIGGYKGSCNTRLPDNWWILSKFTEIQTLLALMNREKLPEGWANEIEKEILRNIQIVNT